MCVCVSVCVHVCVNACKGKVLSKQVGITTAAYPTGTEQLVFLADDLVRGVEQVVGVTCRLPFENITTDAGDKACGGKTPTQQSNTVTVM